MSYNLNAPQSSLVREARKTKDEESDVRVEFDEENQDFYYTIKSEDVVGGILDDDDCLFRINKNGYGYRLSYKDKEDPLCFVRVINNHKDIIINRKELINQQLEDAYNIFRDVQGYFKKVLNRECNFE